jgi:hypothetical protein
MPVSAADISKNILIENKINKEIEKTQSLKNAQIDYIENSAGSV